VLLVFLWLSPPSEHSGPENAILFATLHDTARSFAAIILFASPGPEVGLLAAAVLGLGGALVTRTVRLHGVGLTVLTVLLMAWLLVPQAALGATFINYRMPWAISFFLLAGLPPGPAYERFVTPFGTCFGILALVRIGLIAGQWLSWEPTVAALDHSLGSLPFGARLMVVEGPSPSGGVFRHPALTQVASYAVARRQAFDLGIFAVLAGQLLFFRPHFLELWRDDLQGESPPVLDHLAPDYDYILVLVPETARISPLLKLACQEAGPSFELLRVLPSNAPRSDPGRRGRCS
jgi:hypothetical protein